MPGGRKNGSMPNPHKYTEHANSRKCMCVLKVAVVVVIGCDECNNIAPGKTFGLPYPVQCRTTSLIQTVCSLEYSYR